VVEAIQDTTQVSAASGRKPFFISAGGMSLAVVNRGLYLLTAIALIFFVITLGLGGIRLAGVKHHIQSLEAKGAASSRPAAEPSAAKTIAADAALSNRNIFQPAGIVVAGGDSGAPVMSTSNTYRLVGISASAKADDTYVMIENTQTKLTYFLQYRQPVEGLELERILEDKVIVKIGGKSVELE
jgi:hypothetical protein